MNPLVKLARVALPARWFCQRPFWRANVLRSAPKNSYSISSLLHRIKYIGNLIHFCSKAPLWRTILCAIERTLVGIRPPAAFFFGHVCKKRWRIGSPPFTKSKITAENCANAIAKIGTHIWNNTRKQFKEQYSRQVRFFGGSSPINAKSLDAGLGSRTYWLTQ